MAPRIAIAAVLLLLAGLAPAPAGADGQSLAGVKLALDPGHGGSDPGAEGFSLKEKDVNLDVALRARDLLEAEGATVIMTRDCDCTVSLADRVAKANDNGVHRFLSVHSNSCGGCGGHGTETYYHTSLSSTSTAAKLAGLVQEEVVGHLATRDRGVKQADFYVLRNTDMPAVLVELAFIDHEGDNAKLASASLRQEAARGILHAVQRHYGIAPHDPVLRPPLAVRILSPAADTWLKGVVVAKGLSNQEDNLRWMRFLVDAAVEKWVTPAPHEWSWDTRGWADGSHALRLEAENLQAERAASGIRVLLDNTPPSASILSPAAGRATLNGQPAGPPLGRTVVVGQAWFNVSASDPDPGSGMARVDFLVDGAPRASDASPPYAWLWRAQDESLGDHLLAAVAWDNVGNARRVELHVDLTAPLTLQGLQATLDRYA